VLILDEPTNGLDPPGIRWVRDLVRAQAGRGRAVLISSHLLSEVGQSVDDVVVIAEGELRASGPLDAVLGDGDETVTLVRSVDAARLAVLLDAEGLTVERDASSDALVVRGAPPDRVGAVAAGHGVALSELRALTRSLEDAFLTLTEVAA
jgi:ABC-2 type transport system ATP-binding protein